MCRGHVFIKNAKICNSIIEFIFFFSSLGLLFNSDLYVQLLLLNIFFFLRPVCQHNHTNELGHRNEFFMKTCSTINVSFFFSFFFILFCVQIPIEIHRWTVFTIRLSCIYVESKKEEKEKGKKKNMIKGFL